MRTARRPRRYLARHWFLLLRPLFRYSHGRDAYVLRIGGSSIGPVLRVERRVRQSRRWPKAKERRRAMLSVNARGRASGTRT